MRLAYYLHGVRSYLIDQPLPQLSHVLNGSPLRGRIERIHMHILCCAREIKFSFSTVCSRFQRHVYKFLSIHLARDLCKPDATVLDQPQGSAAAFTRQSVLQPVILKANRRTVGSTLL